MIVERLLHQCSRLATIRWWHKTMLTKELGVADASQDDPYAALIGRSRPGGKRGLPIIVHGLLNDEGRLVAAFCVGGRMDIAMAIERP